MCMLTFVTGRRDSKMNRRCHELLKAPERLHEEGLGLARPGYGVENVAPVEAFRKVFICDQITGQLNCRRCTSYGRQVYFEDLAYFKKY